jgi:L-lactate dehydrogenase (cytochrome)
MSPASIDDYRALAKLRLPRFLFDFVDGGANLEHTLKRNIEDLAKIALRQRVLRDESHIDLSVSLFGKKQSCPLILGPVGLAGMCARRGEVQALRASAKAQIPFCLSTMGLCSIDEVRSNSPDPFWYQLYMFRDREFVKDILHRIDKANCPVLVFTVDMPLPGSRYRDVRSGFVGSPGLRLAVQRYSQVLMRPSWAWDVGIKGGPLQPGTLSEMLKKRPMGPDAHEWEKMNFDPSCTWKDLEWIRQHWKGPLVLKGILDTKDAEMAADIGADGIIVSNHGGRQLDGVISTTAALPRITEAVGHRITVMVDGGVRSGLDVVKMLALGAKSVCLGRSWVYGLAAKGEQGVSEVLEIFRKEIVIAMTLTGATKISELGPDTLERL